MQSCEEVSCNMHLATVKKANSKANMLRKFEEVEKSVGLDVVDGQINSRDPCVIVL